jgi:hypothetical protein
MGILGKILPLAAVGLGLLFIGNIFTRPGAASAGSLALLDTGTAIGSSLSQIGTGIGEFGSGIGSGLSGLFKPFWEIKNLVTAFSTNVAGAANSSPVAQTEIDNYGSATFTASSGADGPKSTWLGDQGPSPSSSPAVSTTGWSTGLKPTATIGGVKFGGQAGWGL